MSDVTAAETVDHLRQSAARMEAYVPAYREALATVLANRAAYLPGEAETHVNHFVALVVGARARADAMREEAAKIAKGAEAAEVAEVVA